MSIMTELFAAKPGGAISTTTRTIWLIASTVLGVVLMASILAAQLVVDPFPPAAVQTARTILAMGAGFASAGLIGSFELKNGNIISATGGFAVAAGVYLAEPGIWRALGLT